jgi:hypothetical protein
MRLARPPPCPRMRPVDPFPFRLACQGLMPHEIARPFLSPGRDRPQFRCEGPFQQLQCSSDRLDLAGSVGTLKIQPSRWHSVTGGLPLSALGPGDGDRAASWCCSAATGASRVCLPLPHPGSCRPRDHGRQLLELSWLLEIGAICLRRQVYRQLASLPCYPSEIWKAEGVMHGALEAVDFQRSWTDTLNGYLTRGSGLGFKLK